MEKASDNAVRPHWTTSSFSSGSGMCVEVLIDGATVSIRDSKHHRRKPEADPLLQPTITVPVDVWRRFTAAIVDGTTPDVGGALVALPVADGTLLRSDDGITLDFTIAEWDAFTNGLHAGELQPEPAVR